MLTCTGAACGAAGSTIVAMMPMRRSCAIGLMLPAPALPSGSRVAKTGSASAWPSSFTVACVMGQKLGGNWLMALSVLNDDITSQSTGANIAMRPAVR